VACCLPCCQDNRQIVFFCFFVLFFLLSILVSFLKLSVPCAVTDQRTERVPMDSNVAQSNPEMFANMLCEKLQHFKDEQDKLQRIATSLHSIHEHVSRSLFSGKKLRYLLLPFLMSLHYLSPSVVK